MIEHRFPWPPSGNHYKGRRIVFPSGATLAAVLYKSGPKAAMAWLRKNTYISDYVKKEALDYRMEVRSIVGRVETIVGLARIDMTLHPPDNRARDVDNAFKCLFDALEFAKVVKNDAQFRGGGSWEWGETTKPGLIVARIAPRPEPQHTLDLETT